MKDDDQLRCPICGRGVVQDIAYDADPHDGRPVQDPESRQLTRFSCGHEVEGPTLATADQERLDVERRRSQETVDP